jgi:dTDP-4-dehydrorhamnose reductase
MRLREKKIIFFIRLLTITLFFIQVHEAHDVKKVLIFGGKTGWIGQKIVALLQELGHDTICAESRLENRQDIFNEIARTTPDYIINAAGITGKPNVDWCEDHRAETIRTNIIGNLTLIDVAHLYNIHVTNISTGCIYEYDESHPMWSGKGFTEHDKPNFDGSFYSRTKIILEKLILEYPNVLNLRVKMPISTELDKGFVGKITRFKKVVNIPNSLTILDDLLPIAVDMTLRELKGNYNFVNPGTLSHHEVLDLYKQYLDPTFTYETFSVEEHDKILKARRANAELSVTKLLELYPDILPIKESLARLFERIRVLQEQAS